MKPLLFALALAGCAHAAATTPMNLACFDGAAGSCSGWRSGQPTEAQMRALGVKSVLKLNLAVEGHDVLPPGVEPLQHPWAFVGPVSHEDTLAALYDLEHAARPILVHCTHGADRTGYLIAVYRVKVQHVLPSSAWAEWRSFPRSKLDKYFLYEDFERETGFHVPKGER
jgi:hypothetical protein